VPDPQSEQSIPSPRALRTVNGVRLELIRVYAAAKGQQIEPVLFGRLVNALSVMTNLIRDTDFEARLEALEAAAGPAKSKSRSRSNGHAGNGIERRM
jgi:hypothetical protein